MHRHGPILALIAAALLAAPGEARAQATRCKLANRTTIALGAYNPFTPAALDGWGTVGYDCMSTPGPIISLGTGSSNSFAERTLRLVGNPGVFLRYNAYVDAARTTIFGDGTGGTGTVNAANQRKMDVPIFFRIFAGQSTVPRGSYSDDLVVQIDF